MEAGGGVRRRLFKEIADQDALDAVCRAFAQMYRENPDDFPVGCRELSYLERRKACYPIHPEVFDRLYDDWARWRTSSARAACSASWR